MSVLTEIQMIVRDELDDDNIVLCSETTAKDVAGWDSLANIRIMVAIERHFQVRLSMAEITEIPNVGELARTITERM